MNISLFNQNIVRKQDNNKVSVIEYQKKEKFKMTLDIEFNNFNHLYLIEEDKDEKSKIKLLHHHEFPDGIFIKETVQGHFEIIVIELKRNAWGNLEKIPKQLYSGFLHALTTVYLSQINSNNNQYDFNQSLTVKYIVGSVRKNPYLERQTSPKVIPGIYTNQNQNHINFSNGIVKVKIDENEIPLNVETIYFDKVSSTIKNFDEYKYSFTL